MKKVKLIYNPQAGQSKFTHSLDSIIEKFELYNIEVIVYRVKDFESLDESIKESKNEGIDAIIVAGGDGTFNRVVNSVMKFNLDIPLSLIPAGTSNDFALHIGMPNDFNECIEKIVNSQVQKVDVGLVNNKYFINVCSAGLFTNSSQRADKKLKDMIGKPSYFITGAKELFKFKPFTVRISVQDKVIEEKINLFLVLNGSSVGGMKYFSYNSSIKDGLLDLVVIKNCSAKEVVRLLVRLLQNILSGHFTKDKNVLYIKAKEIKIEKIDGECDMPDVDGEPGVDFPMNISCINGAINMFI